MKATGSIYIRNNDTWYMRLNIDGKRTNRSIGRIGYLTVEDAQRALEAALEEIQRKLDVALDPNPPFSVAAEEWLDYCTNHLRCTTMRTYKTIAKGLIGYIGETTLAEVDIDKVEMEYLNLYRGWASASTINQTRAVLKGIYDFAVLTRKYNGPNLGARIKHKKVKPPAAIEVYTAEEVIKLSESAGSRLYRTLFLCAGLTGLRLSELRALRWMDLNFVKATVHVRRGYTDENGFAPPKSGRERAVPMVATLTAALYLLYDRPYNVMEEDLVFCTSNGRPLDGSKINREFKLAAEKAELRPLRFHDLRHTFCTLAVQAWPLTDVQVYAGHANIQTTMRYVHFIPHHDAAAKLEALVSA